MPIEDYQSAGVKIAGLLKTLITTGGMRLKYRITVGPGAADPDGLETREVYVELAGPDSSLLLDRGGELLRSLEHVAAKILRLEPEEHDLVSFDANGFKAARAHALKSQAALAAESVRASGQPYSFATMSSRERRMLHLALREYEDMRTESSGEGPRRFVVLYPKSWRGAPVGGGDGGRERGRGYGDRGRRPDRPGRR